MIADSPSKITDYPAAHSMDTEWFAVDGHGHVAVFRSGEVGAVPKVLADFNWTEIPESSPRSTVKRDPVGSSLPGPLTAAALVHDRFYDWEDMARHGVFVYDHFSGTGICGPYGRRLIPKKPLHIDQLSPELREAISRHHMPKVSFSAAPHVQPIEHFECQVYGSYYAAYLSQDGLHILPIPGNEREYERFCAEFCQQHPDIESNLTIHPKRPLARKSSPAPRPKRPPRTKK